MSSQVNPCSRGSPQIATSIVLFLSKIYSCLQHALHVLFSVGTTGPLFDEDGQVLTHTMLGSWEDFQQEAIKRGDIEVRLNLSYRHLSIFFLITDSSLDPKAQESIETLMPGQFISVCNTDTCMSTTDSSLGPKETKIHNV